MFHEIVFLILLWVFITMIHQLEVWNWYWYSGYTIINVWYMTGVCQEFVEIYYFNLLKMWPSGFSIGCYVSACAQMAYALYIHWYPWGKKNNKDNHYNLNEAITLSYAKIWKVIYWISDYMYTIQPICISTLIFDFCYNWWIVLYMILKNDDF